MTDDETRDRSTPIGTVLGATFGPFGAAIGSVVDENRFAMTVSFGAGAMDDDDGLDDATAIEIEDDAEAEAETEAEEESDAADAEESETAEESE
ncbi:MAG: hypothetical protein ACI8UR_001061 [Natronomonas sp.]|jgi:hypothetical protein|uniref:hypothetical protein n=1 Tax=Natronomonas sp. TaxID=2184060 RepID=UPI003989EBCB